MEHLEFEGTKIRAMGCEGKIVYNLRDLIKSLGYDESMASSPNTRRRAGESNLMKCEVELRGTGIASDSTYTEGLWFVTEDGIARFLTTSRKEAAERMAKMIDLTSFPDRKIVHVEASIAQKLRMVFSGESLVRQKKCQEYWIDLAFPENMVAVEIDENGHKRYDNREEKRREEALRQAGWTIVRYNPDGDEPIEKLYGDIYRALSAPKTAF